MANQKAILTKYIRSEKGWRYARVILHKNGTVKGVMVGGQEEPIAKYSEGQYQVKTYAGSNPVYRSVGNDPVDAVHWVGQLGTACRRLRTRVSTTPSSTSMGSMSRTPEP